MPATIVCESNFEKQVAEVLGANDNISLDVLIRQGIPLSSIDIVATYGINASDLSIISTSALRRRYQHGKPLTLCEGDRLYRALLAILLATSIFGNQKKSTRWLLKPRKALGGRTALEATATSPGYKAVVTLLEQLRHGFAA